MDAKGRSVGWDFTGDVTKGGGRDADVDTVEPGLAVLAEDEVGVADDHGLGEERDARLGHDGVLVARELASIEALLGLVGAKCESLRARAVAVCQIDVVEFETCARLSSQGAGLIVRVASCLRSAVGDGDGIGSVGAGVGGRAIDGEETLQGRDGDLFRVGTRVDED